MKPLANNNISFWAGVGLLLLFSIPGIGELALIICAFLIPDGPVKTFARTIFIITLVLAVLLAVLVVVFGITLDFNYEFPILREDQFEVFRNIFNVA